MKKVFAIIVAVCVVLSVLTVFAAEDVAEEEVMLISAPAEETEAEETTEEAENTADAEATEDAEVEEAVTEEEKTEETAEEEKADDEKTADEEATEDAEAVETTGENEAPVDEVATEEAVEIDVEKMSTKALFVNGEKFDFAEGYGEMLVKDGVIFVPVRAILEAAGYQVSWAENEKMVMGANPVNGAMFVMQLNNVLLFYTDGTADGKLTMEDEPFMNSAEWRTYAPLKGVAEAIGFKIGYDKDAALITLGK